MHHLLGTKHLSYYICWSLIFVFITLIKKLTLNFQLTSCNLPFVDKNCVLLKYSSPRRPPPSLAVAALLPTRLGYSAFPPPRKTSCLLGIITRLTTVVNLTFLSVLDHKHEFENPPLSPQRCLSGSITLYLPPWAVGLLDRPDTVPDKRETSC